MYCLVSTEIGSRTTPCFLQCQYALANLNLGTRFKAGVGSQTPELHIRSIFGQDTFSVGNFRKSAPPHVGVLTIMILKLVVEIGVLMQGFDMTSHTEHCKQASIRQRTSRSTGTPVESKRADVQKSVDTG